MTRDVVAVAPETSLPTVAETLAKHRISGVPVVDSTSKAVGVVTLADLVDPNRQAGSSKGHPIIYCIENGWASASVEGAELLDGRADDVMTPHPFDRVHGRLELRLTQLLLDRAAQREPSLS